MRWNKKNVFKRILFMLYTKQLLRGIRFDPVIILNEISVK